MLCSHSRAVRCNKIFEMITNGVGLMNPVDINQQCYDILTTDDINKTSPVVHILI